MPTEVKIPSLGESVTSGILAAWSVKDGDYVERDQVIYELETDKVTQEGLAETGGTISLKAEEGEEVEIGQVVAEIDESGQKHAGGDSSEKKDEGEKKAQKPPEKESSTPAKEEKEEKEEKETAEEPAETPDLEGLSPAVRRIAAESGIDPKRVSGTGPGGRVTKGDMLKAAEEQKTATPAEKKPGPEFPPREAEHAGEQMEREAAHASQRTSRKKMSPLRKKIAERLVAATQDAALLTTFNEVDMSAVMRIRKSYQDSFVEQYGIKLGFMSFFAKAVVHALNAVPEVNQQIDGEYLVQNHFYDIGVAVGTDKGLMVPVIRGVDEKNFAEIEQAIADYAKAARGGKIKLEDLQGGCFTISNGGIYGSMLSTPLLNMPQAGILGLHNIQQRAVVVDGEIVARPMMYLALSYDHRVVDGKEAVTFLVKVKEAIENPERMLFGI